MSPALRIGATGFALIAVCYGFARFAFGLFLPGIDAELGLGPSLGGAISGGAFGGYCLSIVVSAALTERLGGRAVGVGAALVAAIGMAGIALAPSAGLLAAAVIVAGTSAGLASPPMAAAVAAAVRRERRDLVNTAINAGAGAGVALCGPAALLFAGQWRLGFGAFAVVALALAAAAAAALPGSVAGEGGRARFRPPLTGAAARLVGAALLMGAASTAVWSFGGQLVAQRLGWEAAGTGLLWTCLGAGGLAGAWAGSLIGRFGLDRLHRTALWAMAAGVIAVGWGTAAAAVLLGAAAFGAAYVTLTGVYLVWGARAAPERPATGLTVGFLAIAVGQTAGAPVFGLAMETFGPQAAAAGFAALALLAGLPRSRRAGLAAPAGS